MALSIALLLLALVQCPPEPAREAILKQREQWAALRARYERGVPEYLRDYLRAYHEALGDAFDAEVTAEDVITAASGRRVVYIGDYHGDERTIVVQKRVMELLAASGKTRYALGYEPGCTSDDVIKAASARTVSANA